MVEPEAFSMDDGPAGNSENPVMDTEGMSQDEINLRAQMQSLTSLMDEMKKSVDAFNVRRQGIGVSIQDLDAQRKALVAADREIQEKSFDITRELRRLEKEAAAAERKLRQEEENRRLRDEYLRIADRYDEITKDAFWRKDAMPHQIDGGKKLAVAEKAILGDKRGLGKTLTSLITADMTGAKRILYFSPGDVIRTVEREIQHWAPTREVAPLGMMPKIQRKFAIKMLQNLEKFVVTVNFEAWRRDKSLLEDLKSLRFDYIIIDEAHNIKDTKSVGFKGVQDVVFAMNQCPECGSGDVYLAKSRDYTWMETTTCRNCDAQASKTEDYAWCSAQRVIPMTGTPILNRPQDLFALLSLIDRKNFYNEYTFLSDYCMQDPWTGKWKFRPGGLDSLIQKLSGKFVVRDRKSAGVVLPKQEIQYYDLELTPEEYPRQWELARQLNEHAALQLAEDKVMNIIAMIALITRKRQMMTWPEGIKWPILDEVGEPIPGQFVKVECDESIKIDKVIKVESFYDPSHPRPQDTVIVGDVTGLIPELTADGNMDEGERVVLFSQFKQPLLEIERRCKLAGISVVSYHGDTPKSIQDEVVVDFDRKYCHTGDYNNGNGPKYQVVLAHYKKGGVGLNFTDATHMIILDEGWNPGKVDQAYGRIDRIGQTEETTVHVLRVQRSIDTWMGAIIDEKAEMIDGFESAASMAQDMLDAIRNGDMI